MCIPVWANQVEHSKEYVAYVYDGVTILNASVADPERPLFWGMVGGQMAHSRDAPGMHLSKVSVVNVRACVCVCVLARTSTSS